MRATARRIVDDNITAIADQPVDLPVDLLVAGGFPILAARVDGDDAGPGVITTFHVLGDFLPRHWQLGTSDFKAIPPVGATVTMILPL